MRARQFPCDAQPETVPRSLLVTSCAIEALENVWCAFRWNSRSVVADTDLHDVIMFFGRNQNLTARSIVFYGILHQVLHASAKSFPGRRSSEEFREHWFRSEDCFPAPRIRASSRLPSSNLRRSNSVARNARRPVSARESSSKFSATELSRRVC